MTHSDPDYFRQSTRPSAQSSDNWVLHFSALKRLYRLMTQYFADVLQRPTGSLDVPDLQAISKDHDVVATLIMCRMTIAIGVQCEKNEEFINKIQGLSETDQHYLMRAIEQVIFRGDFYQSMLNALVGLGHVQDFGAHRSRQRRTQHDRVSPVCSFAK